MNTPTIDTYGLFVEAICKDGAKIKAEMTPQQAHLLHMAAGVAGEAGELLDAVKKHVIYQKPMDLKNVKEELGDLEFFMQGLRNSLAITRTETVEENIAKLSKRYPGMNYSNEAAQLRADKV